MWSRCPDFTGTGKDPEDADAELLAAEDTGAENKAVGTLQHAALASIYLPDADARAAAFAKLSEDEAGQVRWTAERINDIAAGHGYKPEDFRVEQRVTMHVGDSLKILYFGTADVEAGPTIIFDAKFGLMRDYFAQMVGYLLPKLSEGGHKVGHAYTVYGRMKRHTPYVIDIATATAVAYGILAKRADPNRQPVACEYCGWCGKITTCKAINAIPSALVAKRDDWSLKLPQVHSSKMGSDPAVVGAALWVWKAYMEDWGSSVAFVARTLTERGFVPTGFTKQKASGRTSITDGAKAIALLRQAGVPESATSKAIKVTMTGLVEAVQEGLGLKESAAKARVESLLNGSGVVAKGEDSFKLVRSKDGEAQISAALGCLKTVSAVIDLTPESSLLIGNDVPKGAEA